MARALYREWFVHFRFPGHENHPRVASPLGEIPQGWEVKNVGVGKFIETGNFRYVTQETFERLRCNEIVPGDLLVARMPTPIGRGWLVTKMPWRMITAVDVAIIRAEPTVIHPLFLVKAWNEFSNLQRIAAQASGTTRLRITRRELAAMEFVIPPIAVQQQFAEVVQSQSAMIDALRQQIQNLRSTRDLLLPRLLSGQIEVEVA
jgi:type I restriction enzyme S subunit